jgi:predicted nucleic acid-binding protein
VNGGFVCVDASVAVKWVLPEEQSAEALLLYQNAIDEGTQVVGPPHLPVEVANAIWRRGARRLLMIDEARQALSRFNELHVGLAIPSGLLVRSFDLAREFDAHAVYDATYVALAELLKCDLWTADAKLLNALGTKAPQVKWIGDYSP